MRDENLVERRSLSRVDLDSPCFVNLFVVGGDIHKVLIGNISAHGMQAELPAGVGSEEVPGNARVEISSFPPGLEHLNQISGTVVWVTDGHCGIQFAEELDDENFSEFLAKL